MGVYQRYASDRWTRVSAVYPRYARVRDLLKSHVRVRVRVRNVKSFHVRVRAVCQALIRDTLNC